MVDLRKLNDFSKKIKKDEGINISYVIDHTSNFSIRGYKRIRNKEYKDELFLAHFIIEQSKIDDFNIIKDKVYEIIKRIKEKIELDQSF